MAIIVDSDITKMISCLMKNISLKLDASIYADAKDLAERAGVSQNRYINEAVAAYNVSTKREMLARQLAEESRRVAEQSMRVNRELEAWDG